MKEFRRFCLWAIVVPVTLMVLTAGALAATPTTRYIITNDDFGAPNLISSATFYTIGTGGALTQAAKVSTAGNGISGGFFGSPKVSVLHSSSQDCVFISNAFVGTIAGIDVRTLSLKGIFLGSMTDGGTSNGIGMITNGTYLYAGYSDSNTIGTFTIQPGCALTFLSDVSVSGLQAGIIDGMAISGHMLVVTYGDGSIESFNIANGAPVSNGDEQNSTASKNNSIYPSAVEITQDGHYAIFGDVATSTVVEVSDISSGRLTPTLVYHLGAAINSANILLSPDETLLYISNTQGDAITAAFFDKTTGKLSKGCTSNHLRGYVSHWSYLSGLALASNTGTGSMLYVAEFGAPSSIGLVQVQSTGSACTLRESPKSPVQDADSSGLLSIGIFPPRKF